MNEMDRKSSFFEDLKSQRSSKRRRYQQPNLDEQEVLDELEEYTKEPVLSLSDSDRVNGDNNVVQMKFWKENERRFPNLSKMAKRYLSCPASSTPIERVFSKTKSFMTTSRSNLLPETAKESVLLYYWLQLDEQHQEEDN